MSSTLSSATADGSAIGFPWGWAVLALVLVAFGLAIHAETRDVTRWTRWHDDALAAYGEGDALGASVRTWAAHGDLATTDIWADLLARQSQLVASLERLAAEAPSRRTHEYVAQLADETRSLRAALELRNASAVPAVDGAFDDLVQATVTFDAALLQLRGAL